MGTDSRALRAAAEQVLARDPGQVVRFRLLRDVMGVAPGSEVMAKARRALWRSRWVWELDEEQREDGSWGRFHSMDSRGGVRVPTTEFGVERALALGLDARHPVLRRAAAYLAHLLDDPVARFPDRPEKNDRWPTGVRLFAASTLARVRPAHPSVDRERRLWATIARATFASGTYDAEAEVRAHRELTGASVEGSYLRIRGRYQMALLGTGPGLLGRRVEGALLDWMRSSTDGIGYLDAKLAPPGSGRTPAYMDRWFSSQELLMAFPGWRSRSRGAVDWLLRQRARDGTWDFGPARSAMLPLSDAPRRRVDWTARALLLMAKARRANGCGRDLSRR